LLAVVRRDDDGELDGGRERSAVRQRSILHLEDGPLLEDVRNLERIQAAVRRLQAEVPVAFAVQWL
jgi:hypothetical protein